MRAVLLIILLLSPGAVIAQQATLQEALEGVDTSRTYQVKLVNGTSYVGKVRVVSAKLFKINTNDSSITILSTDAQEIRPIDKARVINGTYWHPDPNRTRLFFFPTGRMLKRGNGYYQNIFLFIHGLAYGITENITINSGMSVFPAEDFFQENLFYLIPKIGINVNDNLGIAAGVMFFDPASLNEIDVLGYSVVTIQNNKASLTAGLALPLADEYARNDKIIILGFEARIGKNVSIISENWIISDSGGLSGGTLLSYGLRIFGEKFSLDLALISPLDPEIPDAFPFIDFAVNF